MPAWHRTLLHLLPRARRSSALPKQRSRLRQPDRSMTGSVASPRALVSRCLNGSVAGIVAGRRVRRRDRRWTRAMKGRRCSRSAVRAGRTWMIVDPPRMRLSMPPAARRRPASGFAASEHSSVRRRYALRGLSAARAKERCATPQGSPRCRRWLRSTARLTAPERLRSRPGGRCSRDRRCEDC